MTWAQEVARFKRSQRSIMRIWALCWSTHAKAGQVNLAKVCLKNAIGWRNVSNTPGRIAP